MEKIKGFFQKIWAGMNNPKFTKPLLIALPCLCMLLSVMILVPELRALSRERAARNVPVAEATPQVEFKSAAAVTPSPSPTPELKITTLRAISWERDLTITVCDEQAEPITGQEFSLVLQSPAGEESRLTTNAEGVCYVDQLAAGEYTVTLEEQNGYAAAVPILCQVKAEMEYVAIPNIQEVAEVKDVSEVSQAEIKPASTATAPEAAVAEEITTPVEAASDGVIVQEEPVYDAGGNRVYTYEVHVGPNGYLLLRDTGEESNVIPIDEDGDGVPEYGLYYVTEEVPVAPEEEPQEGEDGEIVVPEEPQTETRTYTVSVELFNPDNTPVEDYDIVAIPVTEMSSTKVGWQKIDGRTYYFDADGNKVTGLKRIDEKLYFFSPDGVKASSVGIDVSFYNESIDWASVKAQGVDFAIIRVGGRGWSSGVLYDDIRTQEYLRGARAAGLKIGVYFYSTAINKHEAVEEASVALNTVGGIALDYPVFIDMEWSGDYPKGRSDNLSAAERAEIVTAFCETVRSSGYTAGVYSGQNFFKYAMDFNAVSQYPIWLASYTLDNALPNFSGRYDIWQFTDRGQVKGISGGVDMNVIF